MASHSSAEHNVGTTDNVVVTLQEITPTESMPFRTFSLKPGKSTINLGRGSQSEAYLRPGHNNAWFNSRVMSRNHAILKADVVAKTITIEDIGSMHGTYIEDRRLEMGKPELLIQGDILSFGTEIVRGRDAYSPLQLRIGFEWYDGANHSEQVVVSNFQSIRNTFTADFSEEDNLSDDEDDDDDDIQIIGECVRRSSVESVVDLIEHLEGNVTPSTDFSDERPASRSDSWLDQDNEYPTSSSVAADALPTGMSEPEKVDVVNTHDKVTDNEPKVLHTLDQEVIGEEEEEEGYDEHSDDAEFSSDGESDWLSEARAVEETLAQKFGTPITPNGKHTQIREPSPSDAALARKQTALIEIIDTVESHADLELSCIDIPPVITTTVHAGHNGFGSGSTNVVRPAPAYQTNSWYAVPPPSQPLSLFPASSGGISDLPGRWAASDFSFGRSLPPPKASVNLGPDMPNTPFTYSVSKPGDALLNDHKRKANEISGSSIEHTRVSALKDQERDGQTIAIDQAEAPQRESLHAELFASLPAVNISAPTNNPVPESAAKNDSVETPAVSEKNNTHKIDDGEGAEQQPPRKKVKSNKKKTVRAESRGSVVAKYAATALAGVAIGAVGTVYGLAALPPDFFL